MAAHGLTPEDFAGDAIEVWPENQTAYYLFSFLQTQWLAGGMGLLGLNYETMWKKMDRMGLDPGEYDQLEADMRAMEFAAIETMADARECEG